MLRKKTKFFLFWGLVGSCIFGSYNRDLVQRAVVEKYRQLSFNFHWKQVHELLAQGKLAKATFILEELLEDFPFHSGVLENLAFVYTSSEKFDLAAQIFEKLIELQPEEWSYILSAAQAYRRAGDKEKAIIYYRQYLSEFPDELHIWKELALIFFEEKNTSSCLEAFMIYVNLSEHLLAEDYELLGKLFLKGKNVCFAQKMFLEMAKLDRAKALPKLIQCAYLSKDQNALGAYLQELKEEALVENQLLKTIQVCWKNRQLVQLYEQQVFQNFRQWLQELKFFLGENFLSDKSENSVTMLEQLKLQLNALDQIDPQQAIQLCRKFLQFLPKDSDEREEVEGYLRALITKYGEN